MSNTSTPLYRRHTQSPHPRCTTSIRPFASKHTEHTEPGVLRCCCVPHPGSLEQFPSIVRRLRCAEFNASNRWPSSPAAPARPRRALRWYFLARGLAERRRRLFTDRVAGRQSSLQPRGSNATAPADPTRHPSHGALEHVLIPQARPCEAQCLEPGLPRPRRQPRRPPATLAVAVAEYRLRRLAAHA